MASGLVFFGLRFCFCIQFFRLRCGCRFVLVGCRAGGLRGRQVVVSAPGGQCFFAVFFFGAVWSFFTLGGQVVRCVFPEGGAFGFAVCFWCGVFIFVADLVSLAAVVAFLKFVWCFSFVC